MNGNLVFMILLTLLYAVRQTVTARVEAVARKHSWTVLAGGGVVRLLWVGYLLIVGAALYGLAQDPVGPATWLSGGVVLAGTSLRIWSLLSIGDFYSSRIAVAADHVVVDRGPYALLRHPLTLGLSLEMLGLALASRFSQAIILWLGLQVLLIWHNRREERMLCERLGEPYRLLCSRTVDIADVVFPAREAQRVEGSGTDAP